MSRSAPVITSTLPVAPGTSVVTPMYTSVGFNAGDYVYQYGANLVGWPKGATVGVGITDVAIGPTTYTSPIQTSDSRAASYGPFTDQIAYAGTTVTAGQIIGSPVTLQSARASALGTMCATLTNGNVAYIFFTSLNTLVGAIYNSSGVQQGSNVTISTTVTLNDSRAIGICADNSGGYIVVYLDNSTNYITTARINSSNSITYNASQIANTGVYFKVCCSTSYYSIVYVTGVSSSQANCANIALGSNSLVGTYTGSFSGIYNITCAATDGNSVYMFVGDNGNTTCYWRYIGQVSSNLIASNSLSGTWQSNYPYMSATSGSATTNSNYPGSSVWLAYTNNSNLLYLYRFAGTAGSSPTSVTQVIGGTSPYTLNEFSISGSTNGSVIFVGRDVSTGFIRFNAYSATGASLGSSTLINSNTQNATVCVAAQLGSKCVFTYGAATTSFSTLGQAWSASYTNGVTLLTGTTSYTPSNGYYLLGVSLTTAAAGSTGMVATNGSANLFNTYPVLPSNILFDSTGTAFTARSAINAQRGNVIGTNVTLRGLE
jgi:hypothetical protein